MARAAARTPPAAAGRPAPPLPSRAVRLQLATAPQCTDRSGRSWPLAPRDAALLAWLAIQGPTPRARLAVLLWPDSAPEAARNTLRQRLFQLRRQLGEDIATGSTLLALAPGVEHDLADAATVLDGQETDFSADFTAWLARTRAERSEGVRVQLRSRAEAAERAGDYNALAQWARQLLAAVPSSASPRSSSPATRPPRCRWRWRCCSATRCPRMHTAA
jgi:hypothetical protein